MTITKQVVVDEITVKENGVVLYREATKIFEDGKEINKTYHRSSLLPGQSIVNQPQKVQDICNAVWTAEVVEAYKTQETPN